jgi:hypothetical protein
MSLPIVSAIVAHKIVAAIVVASLVTSGGVVAVAGNANHISNVVGALSFTINPSYVNVTSLASLNLGTLTAGMTGSQSSTAKVNVTDTGTYGIGLVNTELLHDGFSVFNVTITGTTATTTPVVLSFSHPTQSVTFSSSGIDTLTISVLYTVNTGSSIQRGVTASNAPFLELINSIPIVTPTTTTTHTSTSTSTSHS